MNHPANTTAPAAESAHRSATDPVRIPRRQRVASAIASAVISGVLLGGVVFGMAGSDDAPAVTAGAAGATRLA